MRTFLRSFIESLQFKYYFSPYFASAGFKEEMGAQKARPAAKKPPVLPRAFLAKNRNNYDRNPLRGCNSVQRGEFPILAGALVSLLGDTFFCAVSLRHTNASLLISQGVDVRTVASLLGHAQASTTLDIYAHAFDKNKRKAQEKLGKAIGL